MKPSETNGDMESDKQVTTNTDAPASSANDASTQPAVESEVESATEAVCAIEDGCVNPESGNNKIGRAHV